MGEERRDGERKRLAQSVLIEGGDIPIDCMLLDISEGGVKLQVRSSAAVPDQFTLLLSRLGTLRRQCTVVWRSGNKLGACFRDSNR